MPQQKCGGEVKSQILGAGSLLQLRLTRVECVPGSNLRSSGLVARVLPRAISLCMYFKWKQ